ncbi:D-alanine--D-alanine ligase [Frankliniella fusca]|uniref:D-alanine--D-alanine ligase n=1 Tax=Frankliniella fusca TaxID=407009 RepID=A0AAE1H2D2_9NEOP|nr:D-alanine--D-alanine ligase [Frankliniella fusca]
MRGDERDRRELAKRRIIEEEWVVKGCGRWERGGLVGDTTGEPERGQRDATAYVNLLLARCRTRSPLSDEFVSYTSHGEAMNYSAEIGISQKI